MELKKVIKNSNFHFSKKFGQNFIEDQTLLNKIVDSANITNGDIVLEIGVGAGTLTRAIAKKAKKVVGYEIDKSLEPVLANTLSGVENCEIVFRDFLKQTPEMVAEIIGDNDFVVIANLPYYITSPLTMRLLEEYDRCKRLVIMVQKEVADRFTAKEGSKDYGAITASIDYYGEASYLFTVTRDNFYPVPNVDSAVIMINRRTKYFPKSQKAFKEVVRIAFLARRKTLVNNLINNLDISRDKASQILTELSIDPNSRGEVLSTEQFVNLADKLVLENILN